MMPTTYRLAVIDGTVHVAAEMPDWNMPELVSVYWPTTARVIDVARYFGIEADDVEKCDVRESRPGEYYARNPGRCGPVGVYLSLTHGSSTESVQQTRRPYPKPRTTCKCEYYEGHWHKHTAKGVIRV